MKQIFAFEEVFHGPSDGRFHNLFLIVADSLDLFRNSEVDSPRKNKIKVFRSISKLIDSLMLPEVLLSHFLTYFAQHPIVVLYRLKKWLFLQKADQLVNDFERFDYARNALHQVYDTPSPGILLCREEVIH